MRMQTDKEEFVELKLFNPITITFLGLFIYFITLFISPYQYPIYSSDALIYFFTSYLILVLGMAVAYSILRKKVCKKIYLKRKVLTYGQVTLIRILLVITTVFFFYLSFKLRNGTSYKFLSDSYADILSGFSTLEKVMQISLKIPVAVYLITIYSDLFRYKYTKKVLNLSIWYYSIFMLQAGRRGEFIATFILFIFIYFIKKDRFRISLKSLKKYTIIMIFILIMFSMVGYLFKNRGSSDALNVYFLVPGDIKIKSWAIKLYEINPNFFDVIFKMLFYYSHSLPWFTYNFGHINYSSIWYGQVTFYILSYLPFISFESLEKMLSIQEKSGFYNTFLSNFLLDFGRVGSLFFIFIFGFILMYIYVQAKTSSLCLFLLPIVYLMLFCSPIYSISIGGTDYLILFLVLIYILFRIEIKKGVIVWKRF